MTAAPPTIEHLGTPLAWTDHAGVLLGCNGAFARWLGVSPRRLLGLPLEDIDAEPPRLSDLLARLPLGADAPLHARRARLRAHAAGERFADLWLARLDDSVLIEVHPADEFPLEDYANTLPGALHAALKGLAHEVKNPLAGLKGAAQLLARRSDDADARRYIDVILHEVDRLGTLVDRLLNPAPPGETSPTNVHEALERVRLLAEAEAGWSVRLLRDYDPSLPEVTANADRLTQALWNLVRNAMEAGASEVKLRTRAEHNALIGDRALRIALRVEIEDDGRGVPDDLAERIFLPLVSGRAEGSGLGLTLAQQVAREHGGSLAYRSRAGHTVFTLLLPID
ncbi:two-component system sensor histidine kinase NtrB [Chiayiivirga flava]|uniref:histidine kinase n=1 Tax=Chiayiivirga flava TaxID=659595 RepID=A0A7W8G1N0_9GAMM|nr:ATP-binding protein [Chiayiivirga flava]MBB5207815.1 two-component system nitrogen regulation sensor histidine kinase GlnL [Chiayiivirga flava]